MDRPTPSDLNDEPTSPWTRRLLTFCGVILIVFMAAWLLMIPQHWDGSPAKRAREASAHSLLSQVSQAVKAYELDYAAYPPGDGTGTSALLKGLRPSGPKRMPYLDLPSDMAVPQGDLVNPVDADKIVYYRCPGVHHPRSFDLWCEDASGRPDGINNWQK